MRQGVELFSCRWIAAVELVHHRGDPAGDEHLRRIGCARNHTRGFHCFVFLELRQHVIREIFPRIAASDAQPQPRKLVAEVPDDRLQAVVPARRSPGARSDLPERQLNLVDDDQQIRDVDLVVAEQLADRLAARVHERQRLGQQHVGRSHFCDERNDVPRRRCELR